MTGVLPPLVLAGLVPATHADETASICEILAPEAIVAAACLSVGVGNRDKPGHDDGRRTGGVGAMVRKRMTGVLLPLVLAGLVPATHADGPCSIGGVGLADREALT